MNPSARTHAALALAAIVLGWLNSGHSQDLPSAPAAPLETLSPENFRKPPRDAGVHVWWHWMDGAITREGITKDLEVMKAQGVVQATILNVGLFEGRDFGVPRVAFASPEWFGMYRWAVAEAARLGLTLGVHNCDGWSSSGGPWIKPEQSMKQFTWTKTLVAGGRLIDVALPPPAEIHGFYRDVAVIAYQTPQQPSAFCAAGVTLQLNDTAGPIQRLFDGSPVTTLPLKRGDRLTFSSDAPLQFNRLAIHLRRPFMWGDPAEFSTRLLVETSPDGRSYQPLTEVTTRGLNRNEILDVPQAAARFVRVTVGDMSNTDAWIPLELGELELLRSGELPAYAPSIPSLGEKTAAVKGVEGAVNVTGTDTGAIAPTHVVVLTERVGPDGRLRWDAPAGSWAIVRFGYTSTGATNGPATAEGRGLECDKMDAAAVEHHFHAFAGKIISEAGEEAGRTLRFILVDSWEAGFQNWTERFPAEFERRRGYSLLPWLPVLTGATVSSARESEAVLHDFRLTIADLIRENYYDRLAQLLHERRVELHAEVIYGGPSYPPLDVLRSTQQVDLPMLEFWTSAGADSLVRAKPVDRVSMELPPCAAVGYGKPLVGSEAYTGFAHYSEAPADLKPFGDRGYATGINRMILHSSVHQPNDEKPGMTLGQYASHFNRNNLYWPHAASWLEYQARIQSVLGQGAPGFDVLYFLGDQLPQNYTRNASTTLPSGYTLTAVNADILTSRVAVANDGGLTLNGLGHAALLSLPPQPVMSFEMLQRVDVLVRDGAHVYGPKPQGFLSLSDRRHEAEFSDLADRVWGPVDGRSVFSHRHGKGSVHWGQPLAKVLDQLHVPPRFAAAPAGETDFLFTHRQVGEAEVFFVVNQGDRALERECSFRVGSKTPEIWDPETGAVSRPAAFRLEGEQLRLPVRFEPHQALLFVFRPGEPKRHVTSIARGNTLLFPVSGRGATDVPQLQFEPDGILISPTRSGSFTLETAHGVKTTTTFTAAQPWKVVDLRGMLELRGAGVPATRGEFKIADLRPLNEYEAPEIRWFSGEAVYRLKFSVPEFAAAPTDVLRLDIGGFESIAEVSLNGQPLGQLWKPGRALDVTGVLQRDNELVVKVVTVYRNRFIGDLAQYGEVRSLRTSSPIKDFLSADQPLKRSGLFGPITLTRLPRQLVPDR